MSDNTYTKNYADGAALTAAKLDSAFTSLQMDLAQSALLTTGASAGQVLTVSSGGAAAVWSTPTDPKGPYAVRNYGLSASTSSGSLIVALKTAAGTNPTASDIVDVTFSSNGSSSAVPQKFQQTSSLTLSVTASATLGVATATTATLYVYALRVSSSTLRLAISTHGRLDDGTARASTAMASTSDTNGLLYSNASAGTYPTRLLGWVSASHTAGSWNTIYKVNLTNVGKENFGISSSSGSSASTTSSSYQDVTNLTVTIATSGRPVFVGLVNDGSLNGDLSIFMNGGGTQVAGRFSIDRDAGTKIYEQNIGVTSAGNGAGSSLAHTIPTSCLYTIDFPSAGSHTYKVQQKVTSSSGSGTGTISANQAKLIAFEIAA